jgi:hypothetical protein
LSDNLRRYFAILTALKQLYPSGPTGNQFRHLATLAALVSGIIASKKTHLPAIASKVPAASSPKGGKRESCIKRFTRLLQNKNVTPEAFFVPHAQALVESLPDEPLALVMDSSQVGRGCMALMVSVLYQQGKLRRALPLGWQVVKAPKGHFSQEQHRQLLAQVKALIPPGRKVIFLGDGEFDGGCLLADIRAAGWHFVCRTGRNVRLAEADWPQETFSLSQMMTDGGLQPGDSVELSEHLFTQQGFGPVLVGAVWQQNQKEPLLLVTSLDFLDEALFWYKKRFGIETFFSDQKSRGFYLCHSHLCAPDRLSRLLIATCLGYYWMVCLGAEVVRRGWQGLIHRAKRCDLSLFQLGLIWLEHCLNEGQEIAIILRV